MNVKLTIPTSLDDITVGQYQEITKLLDNEGLKDEKLDNEILKIVLGFNEVEKMSAKDRNSILKDIQEALKKEGSFTNRFVLNGIEYGFIPNFDNITNGEYIDLIKYSANIDDFHRFLAVSYRPILTKDKFNNYDLVSYKGTSEHAETMKQLPVSIANGVNVFFWSLSNDLEKHIATSMEVEQVKETVQ